MSFNIRYDNPGDKENWWEDRKIEVVDLMEYYHPDFIGIQEGLLNQVEYINTNTSNYNYVGVGRDDGDEKGEFSAIYYDSCKFELVLAETFWLSETPDTISVGWDASMERICTYGCFKNIITNDTIYIFNSHFDHIGIIAQKMSAELIINKIYDYGLINSKIIVIGDFNCEPDNEPIKILNNLLDDGMDIAAEKLIGPKGTFNKFDISFVPISRIDYIFTKNLEIKSYRHIDNKRKNNLCISDHLPVMIETLNTKTNRGLQ